MHVEFVAGAIDAEARQARRPLREGLDLIVNLGREELSLFGPAFLVSGGSKFHKSPASLEDLDALAALDRRHGPGAEGNIFPEVQRFRSNVGEADSGRALRLALAAPRRQQEEAAGQ